MVLIGFRKSSFTTKDTGEVISGYNLYLTEEREGVTGLAAERAFLSDRKLAGYIPAVGDEVSINYNRFGKVENIQVTVH